MYHGPYAYICICVWDIQSSKHVISIPKKFIAEFMFFADSKFTQGRGWSVS